MVVSIPAAPCARPVISFGGMALGEMAPGPDAAHGVRLEACVRAARAKRISVAQLHHAHIFMRNIGEFKARGRTPPGILIWRDEI
jgi:hypothetical protein